MKNDRKVYTSFQNATCWAITSTFACQCIVTDRHCIDGTAIRPSYDSQHNSLRGVNVH